ncbi:MAG: Glyoxalase/bleomycin resistance protein/dioxygenase [Gemmataceae bacterium]|nr:Glyoxalase/bleomycin resistance protein/dioxygenase [Gemmataceae bacterium]
MPVKPIPDGYHTVTPYLIVKGAADAIEYYKRAFGATELMRMAGPDGRIGHAEIRIGDSHIMLADEHPDMGHRGPQSLGGTPVGIVLYVPDVDTLFAQAVAAGGTVERPVVNQFYGDRSGTLTDPFGHKWTLGTHVEDVPPDEMKRRMEAMMKPPAGG